MDNTDRIEVLERRVAQLQAGLRANCMHHSIVPGKEPIPGTVTVKDGVERYKAYAMCEHCETPLLAHIYNCGRPVEPKD